MKTNPRELAAEVTQWMQLKGCPVDQYGMQIGASVGNLLTEFMQYRNNVPKNCSLSEKRRRKAIHQGHLRRILANAIIGVLHYCHLKKAVLSFEEAESYTRGVEHEKLEMLLAMLFQNCSTIYRNQAEYPEGNDVEKDPGGEVFYRVGGQRYLNSIFAIIANLGLGDPVKDVLDPIWSEYVVKL